MRKLIILIISIVITLVGTALIGVYDYNVWYNPEGKNASQLQSDYKTYLVEKTVEIKGKTNLEKTESRITLYRQLENYLYSTEPIYTETKTHNGIELFKIAVYKNVFWKVNSNNEKELDHYRYEVFLYNVNYVEIKNMFKEMRVPEDTTIVDKANDPKFVVNFFPYAKNEGVLLSEIGYIKSSIDRIEKNLDKLEERYSVLSNKIVKVEESVAQAHKRITEHINDFTKHTGGHNHE